MPTAQQLTDRCAISGCLAKARTRGWCGKHYQRWLRTKNLHETKHTESGQGLGWLKANLDYSGDACLIWPFGSRSKGRGHVRVNGKNQYAPRVMCELAHGPAPEGKPWALHRCGRGHEGCVSPYHLYWGCASQNGADVKIHGVLKGRSNGRAILCEKDAREILALRGCMSQKQIAEQFGVSSAAVAAIHTGRNWGWL